MTIRYVTYDADGKLAECLLQVPPAEHLDCMIVIDEALAGVWVNYRANEARDGIMLAPPASPDLAALKVAKNDEINAWREAANAKTFPYAGKEIAVDALSWKDILSTAGEIALFGTFPENFPGGWKATDNTYVPLPTVDDFRAMFRAMTKRGADNFNHSQDLKAQLAAASTPEEIAAIVW
jgi:hypothetical protein